MAKPNKKEQELLEKAVKQLKNCVKADEHNRSAAIDDLKFANGEPLTYTEIKGEEEETKHVYKLINLYGDGALASEYYLNFRPSVLDNGTVKISNEIPDADIINYFAPQLAADQTPVTKTITFENSFSEDRQKEILSNFTTKHKMTDQDARNYINNAIAIKGQEAIDKINECY